MVENTVKETKLVTQIIVLNTVVQHSYQDVKQPLERALFEAHLFYW